MIKIKDNEIFIEGTVEEVREEMSELKEIYGNITIGELIDKLRKKWEK